MLSANALCSANILLWTPSHPHHTNLDALRRFINRKHGLNLTNYYDLHEYSITDYTFWQDTWEYLGIIYSEPPAKILDKGTFKEIPIWFPGAKLNYAENLLRRNDDGIAFTAIGESGSVRHYSFRTLRTMVRDMAAALRANGLQAGDRVAVIITNSITGVAIALATASVGGIFSTTATDMGIQGILDRYRQIQPKFIFAETEVQYAGKVIDLIPKVSEVVGELSTQGLRQAILLPSAVSGVASTAQLAKTTTLAQFLATGDGRELKFEQLPFSHPLYILYSSGTSGKPKCIVHSAGGVLMQTMKELRLALGLNPDDTYFQYTTTGWMVWNFMLTGLACSARIILYDGSPFYPNVETYLKLVNDQNVSILGTSPRFLSEVQGQNIKPLELGSFEALRTVSSTGAPITPPLFEWTQKAFGGSRIHLISTSGGTDVCASLVSGAPCLPVYCGEIQCKVLGIKVEVFDSSGKNIEHTGEPGELVCTRPHPSLPLYFWNDPTGQKLREAYFSTFPGIWRQGDFIVVNPATKGIIMLGRSDGVLNPSGIRFGSAEIYAVMEQFTDEIHDSLCVGQHRPQDKNETVLLFLKMRPGHLFTPDLEQKIRKAVRTALSARHVPKYVVEIGDIPYTVNGKKIEIAVKKIISGIDVQPSGAVANPESLELYYKYRDIEHILRQTKARL
ncbi:hypothetical protein APHAL10511_003767 [Amanita phalloides]|nr:hypothetical protein APHAL10511_003767 [Amanita phalloides]